MDDSSFFTDSLESVSGRGVDRMVEARTGNHRSLQAKVGGGTIESRRRRARRQRVHDDKHSEAMDDTRDAQPVANHSDWRI